MIESSDNFVRDGVAFQKIWMETMSRLLKAAANFTPESAPPELMRQIRNGILQALAESWNEFLRSPQFQEGMKQWLDRAIAFRKLTNDFMAKVRKEMQAPSRDDIDAVMLAMQHTEERVLDRIDKLARELQSLRSQPGPVRTPPAQSHPPKTAKVPRRRAKQGKKGSKA